MQLWGANLISNGCEGHFALRFHPSQTEPFRNLQGVRTFAECELRLVQRFVTYSGRKEFVLCGRSLFQSRRQGWASFQHPMT